MRIRNLQPCKRCVHHLELHHAEITEKYQIQKTERMSNLGNPDGTSECAKSTEMQDIRDDKKDEDKSNNENVVTETPKNNEEAGEESFLKDEKRGSFDCDEAALDENDDTGAVATSTNAEMENSAKKDGGAQDSQRDQKDVDCAIKNEEGRVQDVLEDKSSAPLEIDSVLDDQELKLNEEHLNKNIDSFAENSNPPELPDRSHIADGSPKLPPRPSSPPLPPRHSASSHVGDIRSGQVHAVPPPLSEEMKSLNFRNHISTHKRSDSTDFDLILNRFLQNESELEMMDDKNKEITKQGIEHLREEYDIMQDSSSQELVQYDWPFWSKVVHNFEEIVKTDSTKLEAEVGKGIPPQIRGLIWQLMTNSSSETMKDLYDSLSSLTSPNEAAIKRDLSRTKYITEEKKESLFNVLKAYSLYDPDVGYTQGMGFIVTTFALNCEEEWQSFSLFIKMMSVYGFRDLFLPGMPGLMLKLYQFDTLLEEHDPQLYNHLIRQGIRSSMYATQWFLTVFAYKFPLDFVLRIMDVIVIEGIESLLKFSVTLLLNNSRNLIVLNFDPLLEFLKEDLFLYYAVSDGSEEYDIDRFVADSLNIKLTPLQLERYIKEYDEIHKLETEREQQYEELRIKNKQLQNDLRKLEKDYSLVNKEHMAIANELIQNRLRLETLQDENSDLQQTIDDLKKQLQYEVYKQTLPNPDSQIPTDFKEDLTKTMERNLEVMNENQELRERIEELERENYQLRTGKPLSTETSSSKTRRLGAWSFKNHWK